MQNSSTSPHVAVLLAAGRSRRLGRPKQFLLWRGQPLIRFIAEIILQTHPQKCVIVTGAHHARIQEILHDLPVDCVINPYWETGMAGSLQCAYAALSITDWPYALITACDQPFLSASHLRALLTQCHHQTQEGGAGRSVITHYGAGRNGIPACLRREDFALAHHLRGEQGFRSLWGNRLGGTIPLCPEPYMLSAPEMEIDIDTEADYRRLLASSPLT